MLAGWHIMPSKPTLHFPNLYKGTPYMYETRVDHYVLYIDGYLHADYN